MNGMNEKRSLLKGICLALIVLLLFLCGTALTEGGNERDGSKIESVTLSWITEDSRTTNNGADYDDGDPDHLFLATDTDNELFTKYQVDVSFSGQYDYEPGTIRITLPAQIWHKRVYDGDGVGRATGELFGRLELSVPEAPSISASFNWQLDGDVYVLTNTRVISATSKASLQFTVCGVKPHEIVDMSTSDPISVNCEVTTNKGNLISLRSENELTAQLDTVERLPDNGTVKLATYYPSIPASLPVGYLNNLPGGTAASGNYVAVEWEVYVNHEGNQPFTLTLEDDFSKVYYKDASGELSPVSVTPVFMGCEPGFGDNYPAELFSFNTGDPETATSFTYKSVVDPSFDDHRNDPLTGKDHLVTVWTAYAKTEMPALSAQNATIYYFENNAKCTLTEADAEVTDAIAGTDEREVTVSAATAMESFAKVDKFFGGGLTIVNKFTKDGKSYQEEYPYTLNQLQNGENADLEFVVEADYFNWDVTTPDTWNETEKRPRTEEEMRGIQRDETSFGKLGWRFTVTDDKLYFNNGTAPMESGDYTISSVQLDEITKVAFGPCKPARTLAWALTEDGSYRLRWVYAGEDCYYEDDTLPMADIVFEIEKGGVWFPAATVRGTGSVITFADLQSGVTGDAALRTLYFPDGTEGYRFTVTSNLIDGIYRGSSALAGMIVKVRPTVSVKPSDNVMAVVDQAAAAMTNPSVLTKNTVSMTGSGWVDTNGNGSEPEPVNDDYAIADMTSALYGAYLIKNAAYDPATDDNVATRTATVHYTGTLHETSNLKTEDEYLNAQAGGAIPAETSGIWYDLLPEGMVPDLNTVRAGGKDQITAVYTVPDYRGSSRMLLVVEADLTPVLTMTPDDAETIEDVHILTFDGIIGYEQIEAHGELQKNYMAFESRTDDLPGGILGTMINLQGAPDRPDRTLNMYTPGETDMPADIRALMTGLNPDSDPDEARFVYAWAPVTTTVNFAAISGLAKMVSTELDGIWTQGLDGQTQATVYEGHNYTYRLKVTSDSETITKNIFLFDTIENYHVPDDGTKTDDHKHIQDRIGWDGDWSATGQWRGTLNSIDISEFVKAGAAPVLYYSVQPDLQFADSEPGATQEEKDILFNTGEYDVTSACWQKAELNESGVWTVPAGVQVTAFAADLSHNAEGGEFLLDTGRSATVYLNMTAPDDNGDETLMHAKGAYARTDAAGPIDWDAAADPANNMYAYNNARMRCVQYDAKSSTGSTSTQSMIRNDYTRVGIIPQAIRVVKDWQDDDNHDGTRPEGLVITLLRKKTGSGTVETVTDESGAPRTVTLNEANGWSAVFLQTDIVDEAGNPWQYQFKESLPDGSALDSGYTLQWSRTGNNTYTLTNTRENETVTVAGTKIWLNDESVLYKRPDEIILRLYQDGDIMDELTVEPDSRGQWSYSFGQYEKYRKYDPAKGIAEEHEYTVVELPVTGYFADTDDYTRITNEYDPYGNLAIAKTVTNGDVSEKTAEADFTFTVNLYEEQTDEQTRAGEPRTPLTGVFSYTIEQNENGEWVSTGQGGTISHGGTVTLKANQRALIEKLPVGASYDVTEEEKAGYRQNGSSYTHSTVQSRVTTTASFKNTYSASGTVVLTAKKELQGEALKNRQFKFEVVDENGTVIASTYNGVPENKQANDGTITGRADVTFPQLKFTENDIGKTYTYTVREAANGSVVPGMTYADAITVTVKIADNGDGTLKVTAEKDGSAYAPHTFTNEYSAECKAELKLKKVLEGRVLEDQEFTFGLYACGKDGKDPSADPLMTVKCSADGSIVFRDGTDDGPLTFTEKDLTLDYELGREGAEPEPHYFLVKEIPGTDETVSYTNEQKVFTVRVFDKRDGTLGYTVGTQKITVSEDKCMYCDGTGKWLTPVKIDTYRYGTRQGSIGITSDVAQQIINDKTIYTADFNYRTHAGDYGIQSYKYFLNDGQFKKTASSSADAQPVICPTCLGYGAVGNIAHIGDVTVVSDGSISPMPNEYGITLCPTCGGSGINPDMETLLHASSNWYADFDLVGPCEIINKEGDTTFVETGDFVALISHDLSADVYELIVFRVAGYRYTSTSGYCVETECPFCHGEGGTSEFKVEGDNELPVLTNTMAPGKLSVTKIVEGMNPDPVALFRIEGTVKGEDFTSDMLTYVSSKGQVSEYNPPSIKVGTNGAFAFSIAAGETITFTNLPAGTSFELKETEKDGWTLLESECTTGTVSDSAPSAAVFVNCAGSGLGDIELKKRITGTATDQASQQEFTFEITLLDRKFAPVSGTFSVDGAPFDSITFDKNGKAVISMKAGLITIKDLPAETNYTIKETSELPGWTLTSAYGTNGKTASDHTAVVLIINNYSAAGVVNISVRKLLEDRELQEGEFTFVLQKVDASGATTDVQTVANGAAGSDSIASVDFEPITLDQEGTLQYSVYEVSSSDPSVICSTEKILIEVPVVDRDGTGTLSVGKYNAAGEWIPGPFYTMPDGTEGNLFTNRVKLGQLRLVKAIEGTLTDVSTDAMFEMSVTFTDRNGERWTGDDGVIRDDNGQEYTAENGVFTVPVPADGQITLTDIPSGTAYKVEEKGDVQYGWTADTEVYTGTVESLLPGSDPETVTLTNTYAPTGELALPVLTKRLEGAELEEGQFTFCLADESGHVLQTAKNGANGGIVFENLQYTLDDAGKTYTYLIYEAEITDKRYKGDPEVRKIDVTVEEDPSAAPGGLLVTAGAVYNADSVFTNTASESVNIPVSKVWTGDADHEDERGEITLTLYAVDKAGSKTRVSADTAVTADERAANPWVISRDDAVNNDTLAGCWYNIPLYDENGDAYIGYTVEESGCPAGYVSFVSGNENDGFTVSNRLVSASLPLSVTKTVDGEAPKADNMFSFELLDSSGTPVQTVKNVKNNAFFDDLFFTAEDTGKHVYTIVEAAPEVIGYTTDDAEYTLTVTVTDNGDNTLKIEKELTKDGSAADAIIFENKYAPTAEITFEGAKTLTGRAMTADDKFTFTVKEGTTVVATGANDGTEKITFTKIEYTLDDVGAHTYAVTENDTSADGITKDDSSMTVIVNVTDNGDGTLKAEILDTESDDIEFTNTYEAEGDITFEGAKILTGRAMTADDKFTFTVREGTAVVATGANDGTEKITFTKIEYTQDDVKEHTYTITEDDTSIGGVTKDSTELTVVVSVTDNGDGTLKAEIVDTESDDIEFTNTYEAEGDIAFEGAKTLAGRAMTADDKFTFTVKEGTTVVATGANDGTEKIIFTKIEYTLDDVKEHTYTVTEDDTSIDGVTKDSTELTVVVSVTDNGDGTLKAEIVDTESNDIEFTNTYEAEGDITFEGTKILTGRAMTADDKFTFTVKEGTTVVATGANDGTEKIIFTKIEYTLDDVGAHIYAVTEDDTSADGITKDDSGLTVIVNVKDNGDGTLLAEVDTEKSDDISFENIYEAEGGIILDGEKILTGREMTAADRFTFTVYEGEVKVAEGVSNETGKIVFSEIRYTQENIGTHIYKIVEDDTSVPGIVKDEAVYTVTVTVTDNGDGTLIAEADDGDGFIFDNTYNATGSFDPEAILYIDEVGQLPAQDEIFDFFITDDDEDSVMKHNGTDGIVDFDKIDYTLEDVGIHTYEIREKQIVNGDYITDPVRYIVEIEVSDNGDGTLLIEKKVTRIDPDGSGTLLGQDEPLVFVNIKKTSITVYKEWQGGEGDGIILTLYADGVVVDETTPVIDIETGETVTRINYELVRNGYAYTFLKLNPLNEKGNPVVYTVKEKGMSGYMQIYSNTGVHKGDTKALYDGGTVINRAVTSIRIRKVWENASDVSKRPEITLTLYCNGEALSRKPSGPNNDGWYNWYNLPLTRNGEDAVYYVVEEPVKGMQTTYTNIAPYSDVTDRVYNGGTIINRVIPPTGDSANPLVWILFGLSAVGIGFVLCVSAGRKKHIR